MSRFLLLSVILILTWSVKSQNQFTPYDDLPGLIKSYKPSYSEDLPAFGKMLYQPMVNFNSIQNAFKAYEATHPKEESAIIRYYKMWCRAVEMYVDNQGAIHLPDMKQIETNVLSQQLQASQQRGGKTLSNANWTFLGPKETYFLNESGSSTPPNPCPWQVNVYSLDVAATDPNILYCGTETGFVNKTVDKGLTWSLVAPDYFFGGGVTATAIHPTNPDVVFVSAGNQIHKTQNGGTTWTPLLTSGNQFAADRLRIDATNPQKIYAAAPSGLYVTTNGGTTWTSKWSAAVYDVEIKPNDNNQIYALTKTSGGKFSVIVSVDGGQTFQTQAAFPNNITESSGGLLAVTPANNDLLMVVMLSANNTPYLVKGVNVATSWTWTLVATGGTTAFPMDNGQGYFDLVLDVSPVNANFILVGTTTLFKSANGGSNFGPVGGYYGGFPIHPDIQDIKMLTNGDTWVSTDGGMNYTTDNFTQVANYHPRVNGIVGSDMWGFDQGWNEDITVGGRYHNGNTSMADFYQPKALRMGGAESPTGWVLQGKSRHVAFNDLGNGWILPTTAEGKPQGRFMFTKYPNMEEYGGRRGNMVFHPNYYGEIYLGEETGFWKSIDMGVTWELLYNFPAKIRYLQISYSNPSVFYADVVGAGLVKSTDGGVTWEQKPSLCAPPYGTSTWKGKLFFAISPYSENTIYACLQNGTWSADIGKVFRSTDGGDTWEDWSGTVSEYLKCLVIQPTSTDQDLVYLFTNAKNGHDAKVYYRKVGMPDWVAFDEHYPAGMSVNMAFPFYRDSKLRVGGNASVWESPMNEPDFKPILNPWVEKKYYDCMLDTLFFDDHSMVNHAGATWHWEINPPPTYISSADVRNPVVVLGNPGSYAVTMTITKNGQVYSKTINNMVSATSCPSIFDCNNPAEIPKSEWDLIYVDSEEINYPGYATMSFDNDPSTIWHTRWSTGDDPYPHEIQIALGREFEVHTFTYLTRQDGENGRIKMYQLYIGNDSLNWGVPVSQGSFINTSAPQTIEFNPPVMGKYFRLVGLNEVNGNPWASAAEFSIVGCTQPAVGVNEPKPTGSLAAFPIPTKGLVQVPLPGGGFYTYSVNAMDGKQVLYGTIQGEESLLLNLQNQPSGIYVVVLNDAAGSRFRIKVVKE